MDDGLEKRSYDKPYDTCRPQSRFEMTSDTYLGGKPSWYHFPFRKLKGLTFI